MSAARRTAAVLAVALVAAGCTGSGPDGGEPDPEVAFTEVLGTVDLDAAVDADVRLYALTALPAGGSIALLGSGDGAEESYLVEVFPDDGGPRIGQARTIPAVRTGSDLHVTPDGTPLVVGPAEATGALQLLPVQAEGELPAVLLDQGPDTGATALSPDGRTLYLARKTRLTAVDVATGAVRAEVTTVAPVTHLAATDGGLAGLAPVPRKGGGTGAALVRFDGDLRQDGDPVALVPERGSSPAALQVTADGTAVATVHLGQSASRGRLVTVVDGALATSVDLDGAGDSALAVAVDPDGRRASVPLADLQFPAELATYDLVNGERVGTVSLCAGTGVFGATAAAADGGTLTVTGACIDDDGPQATAFVVG